jgi:ABC-type nickel/cobalt efflux system permease component RcnA
MNLMHGSFCELGISRKSCHSEWSNQRATIIDTLNVLVHLQGWMHGLLAARMTGFAATREWSLLAAMLPLGIVFGSIHALTPGHGKSVLASYLVGSPLSALRSLLVAGVQALTHVRHGRRYRSRCLA